MARLDRRRGNFGESSLLRNEPQYPTMGRMGYAPHSGRGILFFVSLGRVHLCLSAARSTAFYVPTPHSGHTAHSHRVTRCHVSVSQSARPGPPVCAALLLGVGGSLGQRGPEQHVGGWAEHWEAEGRQAG